MNKWIVKELSSQQYYTVNLLNSVEVNLYFTLFITKLNNEINRLLLKVIDWSVLKPTLKIYTIYNSSCMSNYVFYPIEQWDK